MKYFIPILVGFTITLGGGALVASAQGYTPLAPLPIGPGGTTPATYEMGTYLAGMVRFIIALAGVLAIIMAIIGGTQYVAAGIAPSQKDDAKKRIENAFIGLTLVLVSWLILNSINPKLVKFDLFLPPIKAAAVAPGVVMPPTPTGAPWNNDQSERGQLASYGMTVNNANCQKIGDSGCTSLAGLGSGVMQGLKNLATACKCYIRISGGTEYWLHGPKSIVLPQPNNGHQPGGNAVDLSIGVSPTLDAYIRATGKEVSSGCSSGIRYKIGSVIYVDEKIAGNSPHWHVCF